MSQPQSQQHSQRHQEQQQQQQNLEQTAFSFWRGIPDDITGEVKEGGELRQHPTARVNLDPRDFLPGHHCLEAT